MVPQKLCLLVDSPPFPKETLEAFGSMEELDPKLKVALSVFLLSLVAPDPKTKLDV